VFNLSRGIPAKHEQKIVNDQEMAQLSRKLATIITDVPVSFDFEGDAKFGTFDPSDLERLLTHFQFNSLRGKLVKLIEKYGVEKKTDGAVLTLFSTPAKELKTWEGSLGGKNVYMYPLIEKEGDPLTWKLNSLVLIDGDDRFLHI
jgi:DNA polymerase-1